MGAQRYRVFLTWIAKGVESIFGIAKIFADRSPCSDPTFVPLVRRHTRLVERSARTVALNIYLGTLTTDRMRGIAFIGATFLLLLAGCKKDPDISSGNVAPMNAIPRMRSVVSVPR